MPHAITPMAIAAATALTAINTPGLATGTMASTWTDRSGGNGGGAIDREGASLEIRAAPSAANCSTSLSPGGDDTTCVAAANVRDASLVGTAFTSGGTI
jgi:hypothetical protein